MKISVFAGSRRIALLVGSLWALGWVAFAVFTEPDSPEVTYVVPKPGDAPMLVEKCSEGDETADIHPQTPNGDRINVRLCFPLLKGQPYVPANSALGDKRYFQLIDRSSEVATYTRDVGRAFQPIEQAIEVATAKRAALLDQWETAMLTPFWWAGRRLGFSCGYGLDCSRLHGNFER
ncbi:hypothetical protein LP416_00210 [Polaromonas sp. P2-4]|nr:hypothetical protein LP416_00210 [Polaromonas sp. P2-4]